MSQYESQLGSRYGMQEDLGSRARHVASDARGYLEQGYHSAEDLVVNHPAVSALTVFSVGLGLGLFIGCSLAGGMRQRQPASRFDRRSAEKFGRQMMDSLSDYLPESLARRLG